MGGALAPVRCGPEWLFAMRLSSRWVWTILATGILASPCSATMRRSSLDTIIWYRQPMAIVRVLRVEKLAGVRMALTRVEQPFIRTTKGALIAFQAQPISERDFSPTRVRPGDRLWLQQVLDWPSDAYIGLRVPSADAVRREVARRWGRPVTLYEAFTRQVWRFAGAEWVSEPDFMMPAAIRSRTQGKRTWFHLGDMERYVRRGLIEDPTLVGLVEGARVLAVGTMRRTAGYGVELRIERVLAVRDAAAPPAVGDSLKFQEHPLWGYDVRYGEPMLWFLEDRSGGFGFAGIENSQKVLRILRRRKGWRELNVSSRSAPSSAILFVLALSLSVVLLLAKVISGRIRGPLPLGKGGWRRFAVRPRQSRSP